LREDCSAFPVAAFSHLRTGGFKVRAGEHIWAYCDSCNDTRPVNGTELHEYLTNGAPHSYIDLVCADCYNIIATISIGPSDGSPPVQPPLHLPPREQTESADAEPDSPLRRVYTVDLRREGERIQARIQDIQGTGDKLPDALRDLAGAIERSDLTIWVPPSAKTYTEDGQLKAQCPECGHVTTFRYFDGIVAYVCEGCGLGINVQG
jgi:hypothetical protein